MTNPIMGIATNFRPSSTMADALFPKGRQRVLAVLFGNPGRSFYANEVIALAQSGNELAGLLRSGNARLKDARNATLALESQFDLAYNAAHSLCLAALRHMGYPHRTAMLERSSRAEVLTFLTKPGTSLWILSLICYIFSSLKSLFHLG